MRRSQLAAITASGIALAVSSGGAFGFSIVQNFSGGYGGYTTVSPAPSHFVFGTPPDVNGAVGNSGSTEYVTEMINGYYGVYNTSGTPTTQESLSTFWSNALGPTGPVPSFVYDPRILYDPASQRWFATSLLGADTPNSFLVAASDTSNPNGAWSGFAIRSDVTGQNWADFDTLGVNGSNVYVSGNMYPVSTGGYGGSSNIVVIPKAALTAASPSVNGYKIFYNAGGFANQAGQNYANNSPTAYFYGESLSNSNQLAPISISGTSAFNYAIKQASSNITFTTAAASSAVPTASQPGLPNSIDAGDSRLSSSLVTAMGYVWGTQTVVNPTNPNLSSIRWFVINPAKPASGALVAQGILSDPHNSLYYGSIAIGKTGAVVIDFEESGASQNISTYLATGTFNGTAVSMGAPTLLNAGPGVYVQSSAFQADPGGPTSPRWGDYSTIQVDPNNPNDFWIFQELPNGTNQSQWNTQITQIDPPGAFGAASTVPEPGVLPILFLGAAPLLLTLRRRKLES